MKARRLTIVSAFSLFALLAFACGDKGSGGGDGDGDNPGDGDGDNPGDGDGDNPGDGDGDNTGDGDGDNTGDGDGDNPGDGDGDNPGDGDGDNPGDGDGDNPATGGTSGDGDGDLGGASSGGAPPVVDCTEAEDCDDEDPCTEDTCEDDSCRHNTHGGLCDAGSCVAEQLESRAETACVEALDEEDGALCMNSTCTGAATTGCDIGFTFGIASSSTNVAQDGVRTTIISIPVTSIDFVDAELTTDLSNCLATVFVEDGAPLMVTVTVITDSAATCGGDELVLNRQVEADLTNLMIRIADGPGVAIDCEPANADFAPGGFYRESAEAVFEVSLLDAFGDVDELVSVGTTCGSCSGDCEGLSCNPAAPVK